MAGNYPDVPGPKMAYDRDGSVGFATGSGGTTSQLTNTQLVGGNDESSSTSFYSTTATGALGSDTIGLIFPEPRDIVGVLISGSNIQGNLETSVDTTNGVDGTWVSRGAASDYGETSSAESYRKNINAVSFPGVRGIRFKHGWGPAFYATSAFHLYGAPSAGEAPDRLRFWHPTDDAEIGGAYFDWGDVPRNAVVSRSFRVKNPGALTAQNVALTTEALTDTFPTNVSQFEFSNDGGNTWSAILDIGDIPPASISDVIIVRRSIPANATLSLWNVRHVASAASFA